MSCDRVMCELWPISRSVTRIREDTQKQRRRISLHSSKTQPPITSGVICGTHTLTTSSPSPRFDHRSWRWWFCLFGAAQCQHFARSLGQRELGRSDRSKGCGIVPSVLQLLIEFNRPHLLAALVGTLSYAASSHFSNPIRNCFSTCTKLRVQELCGCLLLLSQIGQFACKI